MTAMFRAPVDRYLVPATLPDPPADAQVVDVPILSGLPFTIPLAGDMTLVLTFASGLAKEWRSMEAREVVAQSATEWEPRGENQNPLPDTKTGRLSLALQRAGRTVAVIPVVLGRQRLVEPGEPAAQRFDIWILGWDIRAGSIRGSGDFGTRLRLAWREADQSVRHFAPVPVNPFILLRLVPIFVPVLAIVSTDTPEQRQQKIDDRILYKKGRLVEWRY
jgi:hypothetical protein